MQEIIQPIMDKVTKKAVQSNCKKILNLRVTILYGTI